LLLQPVAGAQELPTGRVDECAFAKGHDGREHREALGMGIRHVHAGTREFESRLDELAPGELPVAPPELIQARGDPRHGAGRDPHLVVDNLVPERDPDVLERRNRAIRMPPRHRDEEIEELSLAAGRVEPDRVAASRQPGHDRFGHAGGERGCHGRVRGRPTFLENAQTRFGSGRVACCNPWRRKHVC
jgi:hypothetical protein